jgi:hypothetical protein
MKNDTGINEKILEVAKEAILQDEIKKAMKTIGPKVKGLFVAVLASEKFQTQLKEYIQAEMEKCLEDDLLGEVLTDKELYNLKRNAVLCLFDKKALKRQGLK